MGLFGGFTVKCKGRRPRKRSTKKRKGIVIEVNEKYGRILCSRSFRDPGIYIFFDHRTSFNNNFPHAKHYENLLLRFRVGMVVKFVANYEFPSKWRSYGTAKGYFCRSMHFEHLSYQDIPQDVEQLVVKGRLDNDLAVANNQLEESFIIHPQIWASRAVLDNLYDGMEIAYKPNPHFVSHTEPEKTLIGRPIPMPAFFNSKFRGYRLIVQMKPLSAIATNVAEIVAFDKNDIVFHTVGNHGDADPRHLPLAIYMDKQTFFATTEFDPVMVTKSNIWNMAEVYHVGCMANISGSDYRLRAFCAYPLVIPPLNPRVNWPKPFENKEDDHRRPVYKQRSPAYKHEVDSTRTSNRNVTVIGNFQGKRGNTPSHRTLMTSVAADKKSSKESVGISKRNNNHLYHNSSLSLE